MKSEINYYILIPKGDFGRFSEGLSKAVTACSISIGGLGDAFGRIAKILRDDKFYKAICEANKYIEEQDKIK